MPNKNKKTQSPKTKTTKTQRKKKKTSDLWITPRYSMKGPAGERAWENRLGGAPSSSRFLELADIALGLQQTYGRKHKGTQPMHETKKTEPYSNS